MRIRSEYSTKMGAQNIKINDTYQVMYGILNKDFALEALPAVFGSSATSINKGGYTRDVLCKVVDGDGKVVRAFDSTLPVAVVAETVGDGDATLASDTATFVDGYATVTITYTGTFAEDDTVTLTLGSSSTVATVSVDDAVSVDTIVA